MITIVPAKFPDQVATVRRLFQQYADELDVDLCFQQFDQELSALPGDYALPKGNLLLACDDATVIGCVALRSLGDGCCEMKRLFIQPAFRGRGLGRRLVNAVIAEARQRGYQAMRLDTLSEMQTARALYQGMGFKPIAPYYPNPIAGAVYLQLDLTGD